MTRAGRGAPPARSSTGWPASSCANPLIEACDVETLGATSSLVGAAAGDVGGSVAGRWRPRLRERPDRRRRVPGLEPRHRRGQRARGRGRGAGRAVARGRRRWTASPAILVPGGFAYGDYLRAGVIARFSPVMRAVARVRRGGRPRPRDLQRLPGPHRGPSAARARCCATAACGSCRARSRSPPSGSTRRSPGRSASGGRCGCRSPTARAPTTPTTRRSTSSRRDGQVLFRYVRRRRDAGRRRGGPGQPERLAAGDRRGPERGRQRGRADAASGDGGRGGPRLATTGSGSSPRSSTRRPSARGPAAPALVTSGSRA